MRILMSMLVAVWLVGAVVGCGEDPDAGHQTDTTPGGKANTMTEDEIDDDANMGDDYADDQANPE